MIVCSCNVISEHEVRASVAARQERASVGAVFRRIGCEAKCGRCVRNIVAILEQHAGGGLEGIGAGDDCGGRHNDERS